MPFSTRPQNYHNFLFHLDILPDTTTEIYIRLKSHDGLHEPATILIWSKDSFALENGSRQMGLGLYFGFILVMAIYNLFLYVSVRDIAYIYYVGYIACLLSWFATYIGFPLQHIWPDSPNWDNRFQLYTASLWGIFALQFVRYFLNTKAQVLWFEKIAKLIQYGLFITIVLITFDIYAFTVKIQVALAIIFVTACFIAGFSCLKQGFRPARYFLVAWTAFLLAISAFALKVAGLLPPIFIFEKSLQFGSVIEVVLLSLGLADRINSLKIQKQAAQRQALFSANKANALKDEFLANTSHELRTPLNGIIGLAESLIDGVAGKLPAKANHDLTMVVASGKRLSNLVNDILDFSKLKKHNLDLNIRAIDIQSLTEVVVTLSQLLIDRKNDSQAQLKLINHITADLPPVMADENRLQQILHNLIGNAIKFTEQGEVNISAQVQEQDLLIHISDTGIGIEQDKFGAIFDSFEQLDNHLERQHSGTGLGLSITKQLVHLHQGHIAVASTKDMGSTFSFSLPLAKRDQIDATTTTKSTITSHLSQHQEAESDYSPIPPMAPVSELSSKHSPDHSTGYSTKLSTVNKLQAHDDDNLTVNHHSQRFRLLLVDDEPVNRQVLLNHLSIQNYHLFEASNGQQALEAIDQHGPFDLVLLDVMMPKISGYEVCKKLREIHPVNDLPIIFLTAKNQVADLMESFAVGGNDYLSKPVNKHELLARVHSHLRFLDINRNLEGKVKERTAILEQKNRQIEQNQKELITTQQQLVQSEKMAALGVLTAGIAHEINNPTNFVHISAVNLKDDLNRLRQYIYDLAGQDAEASILEGFKRHFKPLYDHLSTIDTGTARIAMIVNDLKAFTQLDSAQRQTVDVSQLLQSTVNLVQTKYAKIAQFTLNIPPMPLLECYPAQLNQVFINLIVNACDAIEIQQQASQDLPKTPHDGIIEVSCEHYQQQLIVRIKDNGCGIAKPLQDKIFEPFYTSKEVGKGTGLGLSIAFGIIEQHHGVLKVSSKLGHGSEFTITIPLK